ncbi:inner membrane protein YdgK [Salmonella enterica]|nr:inner membrane protein YdgK [Salmonella enterica]
MTVNARNPGEDMTTTPPQRIGGWLLGPLAWLLVALLSASLALLLYVMALATPQTFKTLSGQETGNLLLWGISFITAIAMWYYTLWLTIAFFKRRRCVPKHYIIWLLVSVLLAVKTFSFSPVSDAFAVRQLLFPLLATALIVPYLKRSARVKTTFVNP